MGHRFGSLKRRVVVLFAAVLAVPLLSMGLMPSPIRAQEKVEPGKLSTHLRNLLPLSIDYPEDGSIFPPDIVPPTFLWRDAAATSWNIAISFSDSTPPVHVQTQGRRMRFGAIDPECVSTTNELPQLTPQQASTWTWTPDAATWAHIQEHSKGKSAMLTITGNRMNRAAVSESRIGFATSPDPVGAPIFYRDVPLMPTEGTNGIVQPLPNSAIHLIHWRLRDIRQAESHTVLKDMPTCANCHSFSGDGKTMGIDIDGPANDKGLYAVAPVERHMSIENKNVIEWNRDGQEGKSRVGFMSQVSPDGRYILSTFAGQSYDLPSSYYITNFKDYRFLQVFYPTRGILEFYDRTTGQRLPLPGADDPHYVQTDGVWTADGKHIVFARAIAKDPREQGQKAALHANDPNETPIQYDLYRIPFNEGKGGVPEPIVGAYANGMSNNFPKVSPDGRWIVFVQCRNGQLMRPDSLLYIVPFGGGTARRLRANTPLMNSWHSFSPNGRWLVFSSKARSPYTQMYLTHLDEEGNSSPAILIDNATASNRAVNLPEFVNIAGDGIDEIQVPAVDVYKLMERAAQLEHEGKYGQAIETWRKAELLDAGNAHIENGLAVALYLHGSKEEAFDHLRRAIRINPIFVESHFNLGKFLLQEGHPDQAVTELQTALLLKPKSALAEEALANAYNRVGNGAEALAHWRKSLALDSNRVNVLIDLAWLLATTPDAGIRNGAEAVALAQRANDLTASADPGVLDTLAAAYAEAGRFQEARASAERALQLAAAREDRALAASIRERILLYRSDTPFREKERAG